MAKISEEKLDEILKQSLSIEEAPREQLKAELLLKVKKQHVKEANSKPQKKQGEISIWWLPLVMSIMFFISSSLFAYLLAPIALIKVVVISIGAIYTTISIVFTFIGLKYFNLREKAVLC